MENDKMGLIIMAIGAGGIIASTIFEIKTKAKIYEIIMKIAPLVFACGVLLWQLG